MFFLSNVGKSNSSTEFYNCKPKYGIPWLHNSATKRWLQITKNISHCKSRATFVKLPKYKPSLFTYLPINKYFADDNQLISHLKLRNYILNWVTPMSAEMSPWYQPRTLLLKTKEATDNLSCILIFIHLSENTATKICNFVEDKWKDTT